MTRGRASLQNTGIKRRAKEASRTSKRKRVEFKVEESEIDESFDEENMQGV